MLLLTMMIAMMIIPLSSPLLVVPVVLVSALLGGSTTPLAELPSSPDQIQVMRMPSATTTDQSPRSQKSISPTENYLPRRLYPGTYGEFCGPTPEVQVQQSCAGHGWHSDQPQDRVDQACQLHDVSYCRCETNLLVRNTHATTTSPTTTTTTSSIPFLSSLTALRFLTLPALERAVPVDPEFFQCINQADRQLITTGVQVRGEMQRSDCSTDPALTWFCPPTTNPGVKQKGGGGGSSATLDAFEKVSLDIFLRDLDSDDTTYRTTSNDVRRPETSLRALERKRQSDFQGELKRGKSIADAASSQAVQDDELRIVEKLQRPTTVVVGIADR